MRGRLGVGVAVLVSACSVTTDEGNSFATGPPGLGSGTGSDGAATDGGSGSGGSSGNGGGSGDASGTSVDGVDTTATDDGDGSYCPASGDASSCASGVCAVVDIAGVGLADIGVCGPCAVDADCPGGVCQPPVVDSDGAVSSQCV
ncbi:MAG: hypothetical protein JKY37_22535 [Nannocystaceae bacterium]|nr:hypothetical protein [Nannocystaceae bacterium]